MKKYSLRHSHKLRKTADIYIKDGFVTISGDWSLDRKKADLVYAEKADWIKKTQSEQYTNRISFWQKEGILILGRKLPLEILEGFPSADIKNGTVRIFTPDRSPEKIMQTADKWITEQRKQMYQELLDECWEIFSAAVPGHTKPVISIKNMKSRLGSIGPAYNPPKMSLEERLFFCSKDAVKQVIFHELCHLEHTRHSSAFYNLLSVFRPECSTNRKENAEKRRLFQIWAGTDHYGETGSMPGKTKKCTVYL